MRAWLAGWTVLGVAGCCSGTAVGESPDTKRFIDTRTVTIVRGGQSFAILNSVAAGTSSGFSLSFDVADPAITPVVVSCEGADLATRGPGTYPLSAVCSKGLSVGLGCTSDGCQSLHVPAPGIIGTLAIVRKSGQPFADVTPTDGQVDEFDAIVDLPTVKVTAAKEPSLVAVTLKQTAWQQRVVYMLKTGVCGN